MNKILSIHKLLWVPNKYTFLKSISILPSIRQKLWSFKIGNFEFNVTRKPEIPPIKDTQLTEIRGATEKRGVGPIERNFPFKARITNFKRDTVKSKEDTESSSDSDGDLKKGKGKAENTTSGKGKVTRPTSSKREGAVTEDKETTKDNKQKKTGSTVRRRCRSTGNSHCKKSEGDSEVKVKHSKIKLNKSESVVKSSSIEQELDNINCSTITDEHEKGVVEVNLDNTSLKEKKIIIKPRKKSVKKKPQPICQRDSSVSTINCYSSDILQQSEIPPRIKPSRSRDKNRGITDRSVKLSETNEILTESLSTEGNVTRTNSFNSSDSRERDKTWAQLSEAALLSRKESIKSDKIRRTVSQKAQSPSTREYVGNTVRDIDSEHKSRSKKSKIDSLSQNLMNFCSSFNSAKKRAEILKRVPSDSLSPREHVISTIYDSVERAVKLNREFKDANTSKGSKSDRENNEVKPKSITNIETNDESKRATESLDDESFNQNSTVNYNSTSCVDNLNIEELNSKRLLEEDKADSNSCSDVKHESSFSEVELSSVRNYNSESTEYNAEQEPRGAQILTHDFSQNGPTSSDKESIRENIVSDTESPAMASDYICGYSEYINRRNDYVGKRNAESSTHEKDAKNSGIDRTDVIEDLKEWPKLVVRDKKNMLNPTINYVEDYHNKYRQGTNSDLNLERVDKADVESSINQFCELAEMQLLGELIEKEKRPSDTKIKAVKKLKDLEKNSKGEKLS